MSIGTAAAATITVDDDGGADYISIQTAVNNSTDGDTILVYPGTYNENVDVYKQLNITSTGGASVTNVVAASEGDHVFDITADGVSINGFSVSGAGYYKAGIYLQSCSNNILKNNNVENNYYGIYLHYSSKNTLTSNTAANNDDKGIWLHHSDNNVLTDNIAVNNNDIGIFLSSSDNNMLANNNVENNAMESIRLFSSSNNKLINNTAEDNNCGISLSSSDNNVLTDNTAASSNGYGVELYHSSNNTLTDNNVENNVRTGIYLSSSSNNKIYNNFFNNPDNAELDGINTGNIWNSTKAAGTNIAGGPNLGGNYWAKPDGTGFSQTHIASDGDGICDVSYVLDGDNTDYLPLTNITTSDNQSTGNVITVDDSGSANYTSIQAAINAASPGNTILVYPGTYTENVDVNKEVIIKSYSGNPDNTIVKAASSNDHVFYLNADNVTISGLTIKDADADGIRAGEFRGSSGTSNNNTLINNIITGNDFGISLSYSSGNVLDNNSISGNNISIYMGLYSGNNILNNNRVSDGIYLEMSRNNILSNNRVTADDYSYAGILLEFDSTNNTLRNNTILDNNHGIVLENAAYNKLDNNTILNSSVHGIMLDGAYKNKFNNNTIANSSSFGITIYQSVYNMLENNTVLSNGIGIYLNLDSNNNTLTNNIVSDNGDGISLNFHSDNNELTGNTISNNNRGIYVADSVNNMIFNNFFNNSINKEFGTDYDMESDNIWNTTQTARTNIMGGPYLGGNYWATPKGTGFSQTCTDSDGDGICDSAYVLDGNNTDYLPLTEITAPEKKISSSGGGDGFGEATIREPENAIDNATMSAQDDSKLMSVESIEYSEEGEVETIDEAAEEGSGTIPGFGVLLAIGALLIVYIIHRKKDQ
jgi:parallel beta-helix repeat protein